MPLGKTVQTKLIPDMSGRYKIKSRQQHVQLPAANSISYHVKDKLTGVIRTIPERDSINASLSMNSLWPQVPLAKTKETSDNTDQSIPEQESIRTSLSMNSWATGATCKDEELVRYRRLLSVLLCCPGSGSSAAAASWWSVQLGCSPSNEFPVESPQYLYFFGPPESKTFYTDSGEREIFPWTPVFPRYPRTFWKNRVTDM